MHKYLLLILLLLLSCQDPRTPVAGSALVLLGVTVIDGTGHPPQPNRTVVIQDDRIVAIDSAGTFAFSEETEVLDLAGYFLLPGFIDMHAHVTILPTKEDGTLARSYDRVASEQVLRMLLAAGITTVRNPAAPTEDGIALREAIAAGEIAGPRIFTAGRALNRVAGSFGPFVATPDEEQVREVVRRQAAAGVDFVKVYGALPPALVEVAIDEAHAHGLHVIGHMQRTSWTQAARFGIDAITHGAPWSAAYLPEALQDSYRGTMKDRIVWLENIDLDGPAIQEMLDALAEHHVTIDPTLIAYHTKFWDQDPRYRANPDLSSVPTPIREGWQRSTFTSDWTDAAFERAQAAWPKMLDLTRRLHERGILLTAGSDLPNPWVIPGVSFHQELLLLNEAGIPSMDVLQIATCHGAIALGVDDEVGTIAVGKRADLVVLAADPLMDIRNTQAVNLVLKNGTPYHPATLLETP
ncbi:MAG TPA: amidohydrolase family protein [Rhodothermales bacterium]|nr:amidohydrolase family protein [Rhodothermales bacterium]